MKKISIILIFVLGMMVFSTAYSEAGKKAVAKKTLRGADEPEKIIESKTAVGPVMFVTKFSISIEVSNTEGRAQDMLFYFSEDLKQKPLDDIPNLKRGDIVEISYDRTYYIDEAGKAVVLSTVAKKIRLIKKAPENWRAPKKETFDSHEILLS